MGILLNSPFLFLLPKEKIVFFKIFWLMKTNIEPL